MQLLARNGAGSENGSVVMEKPHTGSKEGSDQSATATWRSQGEQDLSVDLDTGQCQWDLMKTLGSQEGAKDWVVLQTRNPRAVRPTRFTRVFKMNFIV